MQRGATVVDSDRLQPGEPVAAARAAERDRWLVLDQLAAAVGEDRWTVGEARTILLAAAGRESSDAPFVWKHGAADCGAARANRIGVGGWRAKQVEGRRGDGVVSEKSLENKAVPGFPLAERR